MNHEIHQKEVEKYKNILFGIEEGLKPLVLSVEKLSSQSVENNAQKKLDELEKVLEKLEQNERTVNEIQVDCEQYGAQNADVKKFIKDLLFGLTSNIQVIRENQKLIQCCMVSLKETEIEDTRCKDESALPKREEEKMACHVDIIYPEISKPVTHATSTQTTTEKSTDNIMVIQSMNSEGETIQIYNVPCAYEEGQDDNKNVTVEAKYVRGNLGEPKRASELVLKNVPKHFETTFIEPDETTTEIIVDPDGSKRIIVRKLTRTTQKFIKHDEYADINLPEHLRSQLGVSETTHDVIVGERDPSFEQHSGITESSLHAVIEHISHRVIKKTRKIIKKIVIINGQEHVTEEVIEEPDEVEDFTEDIPSSKNENVFVVAKVAPILERSSTEEDSGHIVDQQSKMSEKEKDVEESSWFNLEESSDVIIKPEVVDYPEHELVFDNDPSTNAMKNFLDIGISGENYEPLTFEQNKLIGYENDNQTEQVFKTVTEAPVELIASEVDKLAPIEDVSNIWPYEIPPISTQPSITDIARMIASKQQDTDSEIIWPQNSSIGSNIDFNEYSFDRTLEKSTDYLDNNSFAIINSDIVNDKNQDQSMETTFADEPMNFENAAQPNSIKISDKVIIDEYTRKITDMDRRAQVLVQDGLTPKIDEVIPIESKPETNNASRFPDKSLNPENFTQIEQQCLIEKMEELIIDKHLQETTGVDKTTDDPEKKYLGTQTELILPTFNIEDRFEKDIRGDTESKEAKVIKEKKGSNDEESIIELEEESNLPQTEKTEAIERLETVMSEEKQSIVSPQIATITIVKTITFLEQEKINSEALMFVKKEPIEKRDSDKNLKINNITPLNEPEGSSYVKSDILLSEPVAHDTVATTTITETKNIIVLEENAAANTDDVLNYQKQDVGVVFCDKTIPEYYSIEENSPADTESDKKESDGKELVFELLQSKSGESLETLVSFWVFNFVLFSSRNKTLLTAIWTSVHPCVPL